MKKLLSVCALFCVLLWSAPLSAGTVMIGAKGWYAEWASATDKAISQVLAEMLDYSHTSKPGTGYMFGPVLGYQTEDGRFSFSSAFMVLDKFTQTNSYSSGGATVGTKTEMDRKDFDFALSVMVLDWLKVYAGYKYTMADYDVKFSSTGNDFYQIEYKGSIPTLGIAAAFPVTDMIVVGAQAGLLYVIPDYRWRVASGKWEKLGADKSFGYSIEPNLSIRPFESFVLQCGLRYQIYNVKFTDSSFNMRKNDEFLGGTLAAIYMW